MLKERSSKALGNRIRRLVCAFLDSSTLLNDKTDPVLKFGQTEATTAVVLVMV